MSDGLTFEGKWVEVRTDDSDNDIEVVQHWVPGEGRWRTYVRASA